MVEHTADPFIPYGRGGAGNMRRQSTIRDAWFKLSTSPPPQPELVDQQHTRRRSSLWSTSTAGERESKWRRLFGRKGSVVEGDKIDEN
ncbi:hypothetical protein EK21DRAFT_105767 [Setomelanomma holmii]|uniref:Uncharacterized protein n=1 Tax=Setomelanomma holmii TaxID=210430 RepID=A0A9P4LTA0_9PLEO|nr:hypothetical protein EK21DRAFT_105767 [Setomelanomma holmii]